MKLQATWLATMAAPRSSAVALSFFWRQSYLKRCLLWDGPQTDKVHSWENIYKWEVELSDRKSHIKSLISNSKLRPKNPRLNRQKLIDGSTLSSYQLTPKQHEDHIIVFHCFGIDCHVWSGCLWVIRWNGMSRNESRAKRIWQYVRTTRRISVVTTNRCRRTATIHSSSQWKPVRPNHYKPPVLYQLPEWSTRPEYSRWRYWLCRCHQWCWWRI